MSESTGTNGSGGHHSGGMTVERAILERKRAYARAYYHRKKKQLKFAAAVKAANKKEPRKVRIAKRSKKRKGATFSKRAPQTQRNEKKMDALLFLREATKTRCANCGSPVPSLTRSQLYAMLARVELETGG